MTPLFKSYYMVCIRIQAPSQTPNSLCPLQGTWANQKADGLTFNHLSCSLEAGSSNMLPLSQPSSLPFAEVSLKTLCIKKKPTLLCMNETSRLNISLRISLAWTHASVLLILCKSWAPTLLSVQSQVTSNRPCSSKPFWKLQSCLFGSYGNKCYSQVYFNYDGKKLQGENIFCFSYSAQTSKLKAVKWVPLSPLKSAWKLLSHSARTQEFKLFYSKS